MEQTEIENLPSPRFSFAGCSAHDELVFVQVESSSVLGSVFHAHDSILSTAGAGLSLHLLYGNINEAVREWANIFHLHRVLDA